MLLGRAKRSGYEINFPAEFLSAMTGLFAKYKEAVISLIIWAIVAIGCLLYFNFAHRPHRSPSTPPSTATTPSAASSPGAASTPSAASTDLEFSGYFVA